MHELLAALEEEALHVRYQRRQTRFRIRWVGRKAGILAQINDLWLKAAPAAAKREVGGRLNQIKKKVEAKVVVARALGLVQEAAPGDLQAQIKLVQRSR